MSSMPLRDPATRRTGTRPAPVVSGGGSPDPRWLDSAAVLGGAIEVLIRHGSETYRLRVTRQNRLILTK
jgi:hemin uptake protein HemP